MRPEDLTLERVAKIFGSLPPTWEGQCYGVASAAQKALGGGTLAYGHYLGPVAPGSFWSNRGRAPFIQHGWVILYDGRVLDPTRWSFTATKPAIWIGPSYDYDRGGQQWRAVMTRTIPPPKDDTSHRRIVLKISTEGIAHINVMLSRVSRSKINYAQACWLASGPVEALGPFAKEFFELLVKRGWGSAIPIDSRRMVLKENG